MKKRANLSAIEHLIELSIKETLKKENMTADEMASYFLTHFSKNCGGLTIYFPKRYEQFARKRHQEIQKEFNGSNHKQLAIKYGISIQWVYKIVKGTNNG